jgi:hypothetical protein
MWKKIKSKFEETYISLNPFYSFVTWFVFSINPYRSPHSSIPILNIFMLLDKTKLLQMHPVGNKPSVQAVSTEILYYTSI